MSTTEQEPASPVPDPNGGSCHEAVGGYIMMAACRYAEK